MRDIGKNIKDLRIRKNMTQDELAEKLFVTRQTVSNYETGKSRPDIDMLERIAEVLDADIQQVLYGSKKTAEQQQVRRLILGAALTLLAALLFLALEPMSNFLRARYFITGLQIFRMISIMSLISLFSGWTLAQLLGMALKKEPLQVSWAKYLRWVLLFLVCFAILAQLAYFIPLLNAEYRFYRATGERSFSDYYHVSPWVNSLFGTVLSLYSYNYPYVLGISLCFGALLWLFGFPKTKKN